VLGLRAMALLVAGLLGLPQAQAHGEAADPLPAEPGLQVSAQAAVRALGARQSLGSTRMDGVLLRGDAGIDPEGLQLEHAALGAAWRLTPNWGAYLAGGAHGEDPVHVEAAWLQWRHDTAGGQAWLITAGRQSLSAGPVLGAEGAIGPYSLVPLSHRATFDHPGADDGVQLGWRGEAGSADVALDLGVWRGQRFPGSDHGGSKAPGLSLHGGVAWQAWSADAVWLQLRPRARGANTSPALGHSHGSPVCDAGFTDVICFGGRAQVLGGSLRWEGAKASSPWPLTLTFAGWWREDDGTLESSNGLADYRGRTRGGWFDAAWQWHPAWSLGLRLERLEVQHHLHGPGAGLLALEARLQHAKPGHRSTLQVVWQPRPWAMLSIEGGHEEVAGQRTPYATLRLVLTGGWSSGPGR
jgi:hypothetical protein